VLARRPDGEPPPTSPDSTANVTTDDSHYGLTSMAGIGSPRLNFCLLGGSRIFLKDCMLEVTRLIRSGHCFECLSSGASSRCSNPENLALSTHMRVPGNAAIISDLKHSSCCRAGLRLRRGRPMPEGEESDFLHAGNLLIPVAVCDPRCAGWWSAFWCAVRPIVLTGALRRRPGAMPAIFTTTEEQDVWMRARVLTGLASIALAASSPRFRDGRSRSGPSFL
jgi:hypothetical protein